MRNREEIPPVRGARPPRPGGRPGPLAVAAVCIAAVMGAAAPAVAGAGWLPDLLANLSAQLAALTAAATLLAAWRRRRAAVAVLALCCGAHLVSHLRPERAPRGAGPARVQILVHNTGATNLDVGRVLRSVRESGADVVVLIESSGEVVRAIRREGGLSGVYPHVVAASPTPHLTAWRLILSRWPLEDRSDGESARCIVRSEHGDFALLALHPASPRTPERWAAGNELVEREAGAAAAFARGGLPVVVAGDLNATPTGWRNRVLCEGAGLRRGKPAWRPAGTFPAGAPRALRLALDDVWVSDGLAVAAWRVGGAHGSDHASVLAALTLTPAAPGGPRTPDPASLPAQAPTPRPRRGRPRRTRAGRARGCGREGRGRVRG